MKFKVLSGMRATGSLHIGHLFGTLLNWVSLEEKYSCFYEIADLHALTTGYKETNNFSSNIKEMVKDYLACGISPTKATIFLQSLIPEHAELHLLLSMLVPTSWLERNPTLKEQIKELGLGGQINYGLLGYPVLQAADILLYKANKVPVGKDQLPHIEITREIGRKFNSLYKEVFIIPEPILSPSPKIPGIDGKKMSKSLKNDILIKDTEKATKEKVYQAFTDPLKIHKYDKGHPEGCVVFAYHSLVRNEEENEALKSECKKGAIGCVECKEKTAKQLNEKLRKYREKRVKIKDSEIEEIIIIGSKKAEKEARKTLEEVREALKLWGKNY
jgi:tryptophanyl-tRNA synthetase